MLDDNAVTDPIDPEAEPRDEDESEQIAVAQIAPDKANEPEAAEPATTEEPEPTFPEGTERPENLEQILEAMIFSARTPLTSVRLSMAAGVPKSDIDAALEALRERYQADGRGFTLENIGGGWQLLSNPEMIEWVERLHAKESDGKLSPAALETLAVVAYRQPVMRADIEAIRGVQAGAMLKGLLEKSLIRIAGRAELLGRPLLYGTTKQFLDHFGLASLKDLPSIRELQEP